MSDYDLKLTPSIMDAYVWMTSQEDEQAALEARAALLATLNRERRPSTPAADRGTALNNLIDAMTIAGTPDHYADVVNGRTYRFDKYMCDTIAAALEGVSGRQVYSDTILTTDGGTRVKLYGYADYVLPTRIIDLKTTSSWTPGKYRDKWQHYIYTLTLTDRGLIAADTLEAFTYLIAEGPAPRKEGEEWKGELRIEEYTHTPQQCREAIGEFLDCELLPWIAANRGEIYNDYYFN